MSTPSSSTILQALRSVLDPDLKQDLVTLNMIRDLVVHPNGEVSLRVVLTTPACPLKAKIEKDVREAIRPLPGVTSIVIKMDAEVKQFSGAGGSNSIPGVAQIIAVSSGKGGVGKSTTAVNLAVALAAEGARVGIMDADIYGPNLPTMLGVTTAPTIEVREGGKEVFVPPTAHGLKVMSMGFLIDKDQPMIWRGPMLHNVLTQFLRQVEWGDLDYLIVDMPPGTGDIHLSLAQLVPLSGAVMVTTPQEVALQDVRKAILMWEKVRVPLLGIVENMSYFVCPSCSIPHELFGSGGGVVLAKKYATELLARVPLVQKVREGGDEGRPITIQEPDSEPAKQYRALANKIAQKLAVSCATSARGAAVEIGQFH